MTDYIAVLLAQQEEQEQGEAPELETGPLTVWLEENTRPAEAAAARRGVEQGGDGGAVRRSGGHSGGGRGAGPAVSPGRPAV